MSAYAGEFKSGRPDDFPKVKTRAAKTIPVERVIRIGRDRSEGANPGGPMILQFGCCKSRDGL